MLFSSLEFLYLFLPLTLIVYYLSPARWRNVVLLGSSLLFYGAGEPVFLWLMALTVLADYGFGLWIERRAAGGRSPKPVLFGAVILHVGVLVFFKYYDPLAEALSLPTVGVPLPVGISFYTFQALSYVIDVYRREVAAQKSLVAFGAYVSLFPQLVAGPIVRYGEIDGQLKERSHTVRGIAAGIGTFSVGLAKKVLLANGAGELHAALGASGGTETVLGVWLWLILFALQIYFDFSGYSDMAIGLGRLFGFEFPKNFCYPYVSTSITDFWRRWHMTLSGWFRAYVYIPLGGNRRGRWRTYLNLLVTWSLTGLWHGASLNFLFWGLYFFFLLVLEKAALLRLLKRSPTFVCRAYALFFVLLGWLIFSAEGSSLGEMLSVAGRLFGVGASAWSTPIVRYELLRNLPFLLLLILGSTPLPLRLWERLGRRLPRVAEGARVLSCLASLTLCTAYLVNSGYNPFLYFRF